MRGSREDGTAAKPCQGRAQDASQNLPGQQSPPWWDRLCWERALRDGFGEWLGGGGFGSWLRPCCPPAPSPTSPWPGLGDIHCSPPAGEALGKSEPETPGWQPRGSCVLLSEHRAPRSPSESITGTNIRLCIKAKLSLGPHRC